MCSENEEKHKVFKLTCFKGTVKNTHLFYMFLPRYSRCSGAVTLDGGSLCRASSQACRRKKKNIQADPRIARTQSKANTLCHVRGLSHVLHLFLAFNVLPRVSWMVSSSSRWVADTLKQEGTPCHDPQCKHRKQRGAWTSYIISPSGCPAPGT